MAAPPEPAAVRTARRRRGSDTQARERARLAGSRWPGPRRTATRRGDLSRTIARHQPLPALAPGEATRADFTQSADISPVPTIGPEPYQPVRAPALSGHTRGCQAQRGGGWRKPSPGGKRSAQRHRREGVTGLKSVRGETPPAARCNARKPGQPGRRPGAWGKSSDNSSAIRMTKPSRHPSPNTRYPLSTALCGSTLQQRTIGIS